jgi:murein DD-endopeptidase MepM/ murein hydrolase activator NlpD
VGCITAPILLKSLRNRQNAPAPALSPPQAPAPVILPALDLPEPKVLPAILRFQLPTNNHALTEGRPEDFYMYVERWNDAKVMSREWQGGSYGFTRTRQMLKDGSIIFKKFHEGIDILPVRRDARGEPMDTVHGMADGVVVHANQSASGSNYGKYVVIQHATNSGPFYSLYAHLSQVSAKVGQRVLCGDLLGVMGYTGAGINKPRAHVHVELNMLLSSRYSEWHARDAAAAPNTQGHFNGQNLVGVDVAGWLRVNNQDARNKLSEYVIAQGPQWKVTVPNRRGELEIARRYPWLRQPGAANCSWEITLASSGTPLAVVPSDRPVAKASVTWVKPFGGDHRWVSREMLSGTGSTAVLTSSGTKFVGLITGDF